MEMTEEIYKQFIRNVNEPKGSTSLIIKERQIEMTIFHLSDWQNI